MPIICLNNHSQISKISIHAGLSKIATPAIGLLSEPIRWWQAQSQQVWKLLENLVLKDFRYRRWLRNSKKHDTIPAACCRVMILLWDTMAPKPFSNKWRLLQYDLQLQLKCEPQSTPIQARYQRRRRYSSRRYLPQPTSLTIVTSIASPISADGNNTQPIFMQQRRPHAQKHKKPKTLQ